MVGALDALTPGRMSAHEVAMAAHRVEVEALGKQSGVQDQLASAYGGASYIEILDYPHAARSPAEVSPRLLWEIESRLIVVFLGRSHDSSHMHEAVIAQLTREGGDARPLEDLRQAARDGRDALARGDIDGFGRVMDANTEAQARLHAGLVSPDAVSVMRIARELGAVGVKLNGAGGEGGSLTVLCGPDPAARRATVRALEDSNPLFRCLPVRLSAEGLRRWTYPFEGGVEALGR